jgi:hypothetical protein
MQLGVQAANREQLGMGAPLYEAATVQAQDLVGAQDGRQPLGDHHE